MSTVLFTILWHITPLAAVNKFEFIANLPGEDGCCLFINLTGEISKKPPYNRN